MYESQKTFEEWNLKSFYCSNKIVTDADTHEWCSFSHDGEYFSVISNSDTINIFRCDGCSLLYQRQNKKYKSTICEFHKENNHLMYINSQGASLSAKLLDVHEYSFVRYFPSKAQSNQQYITLLKPMNRGLITSHSDGSIHLWDDNAEDKIGELIVEPYPSFDIHPSGICLAVTTSKYLRIYDLRNTESAVAKIRLVNIGGELKTYFGPIGNKLMILGKGIFQQFNTYNMSLNFSSDGIDTDSLGLGFEQHPAFAYTQDENFFLLSNKDSKILAFDSSFEHRPYRSRVNQSLRSLLTYSNLISVYSGHNSSINRICFSPKYQNFVSTGNECLFWSVDQNSLTSFKNKH